MKFIDLLGTANRNLTRSKLRTLLTILAIFVGGFTLSLTTALNTGAQQYMERQLGNVSVPGIFQVMPKTELNPFSTELKEYDPEKKQLSLDAAFTASMTQEDVDKLQKVEGVGSVKPYYQIQAEYINHGSSKKYQIGQISQDFGLNLDLAHGSLLEDTDTHSVILPEDYIEPLDLDSAEAVGESVTIAYRNAKGLVEERQFTIKGVMRKTFVTAGQIFIDINSAKDIADQQGQSSRYVAIFVRFNDVNEQTDEAALKERLHAAGNYTAVSMKERISNLITIVSAITAGLNVVGIIALIAASFGIINTLLMSVYERTQEIGLMKALGMSRRKVFGLFAIEAVLVGFWGSLVAVAIAWATAIGVNQWASSSFLKDFEGFTLLVMTPTGALFVVGLIMLIAFLAGTLPALKASRLNPIDALRNE